MAAKVLIKPTTRPRNSSNPASIINLSCDCKSANPSILELAKNKHPASIPLEMIPDKIPYTEALNKNGVCINPDVAPTNCMLLIKNL